MAEVVHPRDRLYLQVDRGIGHLGLRVQDTKPTGLEGATNQAPGRSGDVLRLSTGLTLHGVLRIALDSTHFSRLEREYRSSNASLKLKRNMHSLGLSLIMDMSGDNDSRPGLYTGVRSSFNTLQTKTDYTLDGVTQTSKTRRRYSG